MAARTVGGARVGASLTTSAGTPAARVARTVANPTTTTPTPTPSSPTAISSSPASRDYGARLASRRPTGNENPATATTTGLPGSTSTTSGISPSVDAAARMAARSRAMGSRVAASRQAPEIEVPAGTDPSAVADVAAGRTGSRRTFERRPSQQVVEKEKKTEYWKDVAQEVQKEGKVSGDDLNHVISRAMTLGIVGDRKQRESLSGPKANELLTQLKDGMEIRLKELGGGQVNTEALLKTNASLMEKIMGLEKVLQTLEKRKSEQEDQERVKIQSKIGELERSLRELEQAKTEQREQNRKTMKLEIANLKEMMTKVQQEKQSETAATAEAKAMAAKMARLEAALRLMNEDRKKKVEDKETLLLKRKLVLFEQKFKEMEETKKVKQTEQESNELRDKLLLMEEKLTKMEKRKSMSMTMAIQQKMDGVEKQLTLLRNEQGKGHSDETSAKIAAKMKQLEDTLKQLSTQKNVTPAMVNDEETVALRTHVKKLEESMFMAEKKMEEQRKKVEEERRLAYEKRLRDEEEFRRQAREKEDLIIQKIAALEGRLKTAPGGGPPLPIDPTLLARLDQLERNKGTTSASPEVISKLKLMEDQLYATQKALEQERESTKKMLETPKNGVTLEDIQLEWLKQTNAQLIAKLEATTSLMDKKMEEVKTMAISMPAGGGAVHKSGLAYEEINKKLAELQAKLFDPNTDERESEQLNIEYEKLITELEQTPEYQAEQEKIREKWKKDNAPLNKESFDTVTANLKSMNDNQVTTILKKKPELKLLQRTPDQIMKAHENDFKQLSTQMLDLDEARALYHNMPAFRKDQAKQCEWLQQLQQKIEVEASKPKVKAPPPIQATKKIVIKKAEEPEDSGGGGGGFLEELLKKRKRRD